MIDEYDAGGRGRDARRVEVQCDCEGRVVTLTGDARRIFYIKRAAAAASQRQYSVLVGYIPTSSGRAAHHPEHR